MTDPSGKALPAFPFSARFSLPIQPTARMLHQPRRASA